MADQNEPAPIKPGAFNNLATISRIVKKVDITQSLDILASNVQPFCDPTNDWVPALALFHYTTKNHGESPLVLMLADLFCDNVPASARSNNALDCLVKSARRYIGSMESLQPDWSKVTPANYEAAMEQYPKWPTIRNPAVDSNGANVEVADLLQAWSYCFKTPSNDVIFKIRSALWYLVLVSFSNGAMTRDNVKQTFPELSNILDYELTIIPDFPLLGNILPSLISEKASVNLYHYLVGGCSLNIHKITKRSMVRCLPKMWTIAKAVIRFPDFAWCLIPNYDQWAILFSNDVNRLMIESGNQCYLIRIPAVGWNPSFYEGLVYAANELLIRYGGGTLMECDFSFPHTQYKGLIRNLLKSFDGEMMKSTCNNTQLTLTKAAEKLYL